MVRPVARIVVATADEPVERQLYREEWLMEVGRAVAPLYKTFNMGPYRLTCGWPCRRGLSRKGRVLGECHPVEASADGVSEIFISPTIADPIEVSGVVCHELAHVAAGTKAGHKGQFITVCKFIGLTKNKPTSAAPGERLEIRLRKIVESLGPYPHAIVSPVTRPRDKERKDVTLECPGCGCKVRMTLKWLFEAGPPTCGCGEEMGIPES